MIASSERSEAISRMLLRIPSNLKEKVRELSFKMRKSQNTIAKEALALGLPLWMERECVSETEEVKSES